VVGSRVKVKIVKNKVAPPFRVCEFDMMYDHGISREGDLMDLGIADKIIEKSGSWFNYGDTRLGQGRENAKTFLKDNPAVADEVSAKIMAKRSTGEVDFSPVGSNGELADDEDEAFEEA
jgi:recombination protein RecA